MNTLPKVASNIYHPCKKCEAERYHRVLAHVDSKTAKLECEACGSKKTLKISEGSTMAKKTATKKPRAAKSTKGNSLYIDLKEKVGDVSPEPYRMSNTYVVNKAIEHPKFGTGIVFATTPEKIEVAFPDMNRSFVQNRK